MQKQLRFMVLSVFLFGISPILNFPETNFKTDISQLRSRKYQNGLVQWQLQYCHGSFAKTDLSGMTKTR